MTNKTTLKKFGFWSIVLLTINSIIGTGIFLTPASVIEKASVWTPLVYLAAAAFAGVLAITFASAAKYVTQNGAAYAYAKAAFGNKIGLYVGITRFVAGTIAWGVMATAVVRTTLDIFKGPGNSTNVDITIGFLVLMSILLIINLLGTYIVEIINNLSTIGKLAALVTAIIAGFIIFVSTGQNHYMDVATLLPDVNMNFGAFVAATITAFYAYTGFESVASAASDMENPQVNLPKAIPLAMLIIASIYIGIVTIAMVVNPTGILESKEVVRLAAAYTNPWIQNVIVYGALISMFGINVAASFSTPKIFQAMASADQVPAMFAKVNSKGVSVPSFLLTVGFAIIIPMAFQYDTADIIVISSISRFLQFIVVPLAVIVFFKGKAINKNEVLADAPKNKVTDVFIPILGLGMTVILLANFNWVGQFSVSDATTGVLSPNWYAIAAMVIGFVVFPVILLILNNRKKQ